MTNLTSRESGAGLERFEHWNSGPHEGDHSNESLEEPQDLTRRLPEARSLAQLSQLLSEHPSILIEGTVVDSSRAVELVDGIRAEMISKRDQLITEELRGDHSAMRGLIGKVEALAEIAGEDIGFRTRQIIQEQLREYFKNSHKDSPDSSLAIKRELASKAVNEARSFDELLNIASRFKYVRENMAANGNGEARAVQLSGSEICDLLQRARQSLVAETGLGRNRDWETASTEVRRLVARLGIPLSHGIRNQAVRLLVNELVTGAEAPSAFSNSTASSMSSSSHPEKASLLSRLGRKIGGWLGRK